MCANTPVCDQKEAGIPIQALAQVDRLIAGMEADLDAATAALDTTLQRLETTEASAQEAT
ncbi:hypothetical protein [Nitrospirillum bahiense]|uniref:hypothetical protein n=1 Tax=Nitrospirillum amazonense TaxID=28077 RepID=UPI0011A37912|nr:hypothetical protein [Nitrospirillum amazonense]